MEDYKDIDVPDFMKSKTEIPLTKEQQELEIEKAFIKGGLSAIVIMFGTIILMILIALVEAI